MLKVFPMGRLVRFLALYILAGILTANMPISAYAEEKTRRWISMSASGTIETEPDLAFINTGVTTDAKTARGAVNQNSKAMKRIIARLKSKGIQAKDIQTSNFSVNPQYENYKSAQSRKRAPRVIGYRVSNSVRIVVRDIKRLGRILDEVVSQGSNRINGISFGVSKADEMRDEARKLAVKNAVARAKLYAEASGVKLGKIFSIQEGASYQPARNIRQRSFVEAKASVPIEAGSQSITAQVAITWEIED